uniref:Uncharacterized protein n=2 Tax=Picea TaxID=3328 RepID=A0A101M217_PICGL|nr:hypothetical protein ABT39_MTgene4023 [Picea glauca]QHR89717.1 hypothetical protein Q903MT_gene3739 [Picea sitchensis]
MQSMPLIAGLGYSAWILSTIGHSTRILYSAWILGGDNTLLYSDRLLGWMDGYSNCLDRLDEHRSTESTSNSSFPRPYEL